MTGFEIIISFGLLSLAVLLAILIVVILRRSGDKSRTNETEKTLANLQGQLTILTNTIDNRIETVDKNLATNLDRTQKTLSNVSERLGEVRESSKRLEEIGKDVSSLQDLLKPPQARGAVGETLLENILRSMLPPKHYKLQFPLDSSSGARVDAVVIIDSKYVPIDAKFPVQDYERIAAAQDETEREKARKSLIANVKTKADDIAAKYIKPNLGTYDFALMYIPAEAVYYETMVLGDIFDYATSKNVIPVSPSTFYLYLYTVLIGLRGLKVEEEAQTIMENLSHLGIEIGAFYDEYQVLGKHLANAHGKYDEGDRKLIAFRDSLNRLSGKERDSLLPGSDVGD
ncbi:MAG: DNA recombination protein RmuC [bacterium]|nr:DNA recombination protein RmuC [bacterium]